MNLVNKCVIYSGFLRNTYRPSVKSVVCHMSNHSSPLDAQDDAEEVRITVPWGHLAGKWWGPKDVRPILCIHGWQDNAGTFDRLIPLLPKHVGYLAFDLPGHGHSSWYPNGVAYHALDYVNVISFIKKAYHWDKISILAHSVGSIASFNFCGLYSDEVDLMIGIDFLKNHIFKVETMPQILGASYRDLIVADERNRSSAEPPAYSFEEALKRLNEGTKGSISYETGHHILRRNLRKSEKHPDKYYFARDNRLKCMIFSQLRQEVNVEFAKRMRMPYMFIKASKAKLMEEKKYLTEVLETMTAHNPHFEWHTFEGAHHIHLTSPEVISGAISKFICKVRSGTK